MTVFNYDGLVNAASPEVASVAFAIVDRLQNFQPHVQAAGVAATFLLLCSHYRVDPADVFRAASNMLANDQAGEHPEFAAVRDYIRYELK